MRGDARARAALGCPASGLHLGDANARWDGENGERNAAERHTRGGSLGDSLAPRRAVDVRSCGLVDSELVTSGDPF